MTPGRRLTQHRWTNSKHCATFEVAELHADGGPTARAHYDTRVRPGALGAAIDAIAALLDA
jgi:hypothetical protein